MPYVFVFVIMIVAAGALLLFRQPAEEAVVTNTDPVVEEAPDMRPEAANNVPEGFTPPTTPPPSSAEETELTPAESEVTSEADKPTETYTAAASYFTPNRTEHEMMITLELAGKTVVDANIDYDGAIAQTPNHINFNNAYISQVIGQNINDIQLSRVGGASLSSNTFNEAVADIKAQL
jgi:hypothetical protein